MRLTPLSILKFLFTFPPFLKLFRTTPFSFLNPTMSLQKKSLIHQTPKRYFLDLPDLVLECILEKLPPDGLFRMASVCSSLRDMCSTDHLWERHMKKKWGEVIGTAAYKEWQCQIASRKGSIFYNEEGKEEGWKLVGYFLHLWPLPLTGSRARNGKKRRSFPPIESMMAWYLALESGRCWFPAQVYNRENGNIGFVLSCYDAQLSYDRGTDTFQARYPPHGRRASAVEIGVTWDRLRAPAIDASPHDLHISDCLNDMQPGDQIEIQWRRSKEFPYGWWYGVVGHLETCDRNSNYCRCHHSETLVLEFKQYTQGSRWRTMMLDRKHHREQGNETIGFYGGIRKLCGAREVSMWEKLWPTRVLE